MDASEGVKKLISRDIAQNFLRVFDLQSIFKTSPDDFGGPDTCRIQLIHTFSLPAYDKRHREHPGNPPNGQLGELSVQPTDQRLAIPKYPYGRSCENNL